MSKYHSTADTSSGNPDQRQTVVTPSEVLHPGKPSKPYPDFPLTPHAAGQWCKKIKRQDVLLSEHGTTRCSPLQAYQRFLTTGQIEKRGGKVEKPSPPNPEFPLFAHSSGQWAKKIRVRRRYYTLRKWGDPDAALKPNTPSVRRSRCTPAASPASWPMG